MTAQLKIISSCKGANVPEDNYWFKFTQWPRRASYMQVVICGSCPGLMLKTLKSYSAKTFHMPINSSLLPSDSFCYRAALSARLSFNNY